MPLFPLMIDVDHRWAPGIGDPTFTGWFTVAIYFGVAALCMRSGLRARGQTGSSSLPDVKLAAVWLGLAALCTVLGINKQLDLQSLLTQIGEDMAHAQGWYEDRRAVQTVFVGGVALGGCVAGAAALYWLRDRLAQLWPAIVGTALLLSFVVIRAASFHHVDALLYATGPLELNWVIELGALFFLGWAALRKVEVSYQGPLRPARSRRGPKVIPAGPNGQLLPERRRRS